MLRFLVGRVSRPVFSGVFPVGSGDPTYKKHSPGRLWKALPQHSRTTVAAIALLAIAVSITLTQVPWRDAGRPVDRSAESEEARTTATPRGAPGNLHTSAGASRAAQGDHLTPNTDFPFVECDFDPRLDWGATDDEMRQITQQGDELMSRINRLWDDIPAFTPGEQPFNPTDTNPSLTEESDP